MRVFSKYRFSRFVQREYPFFIYRNKKKDSGFAILKYFFVCNYPLLFEEQRQRLQENNVVSFRRVAFRKHRHSPDDLTARDTHEFLNRVQTFARRNNVVDDKDTLAFHSVDVKLVKIKRLDFRRRDGLHLNLNGIDHIGF